MKEGVPIVVCYYFPPQVLTLSESQREERKKINPPRRSVTAGVAVVDSNRRVGIKKKTATTADSAHESTEAL